MKKIFLSQPVVEEMMEILQATIQTNTTQNSLSAQQSTMLEMLRSGLDSLSTDMNLQRVLEIYDQPTITASDYKKAEMWILDPVVNIPERTAQQFLGNLGKKIKYST
jgi:hypothetical protein